MHASNVSYANRSAWQSAYLLMSAEEYLIAEWLLSEYTSLGMRWEIAGFGWDSANIRARRDLADWLAVCFVRDSRID